MTHEWLEFASKYDKGRFVSVSAGGAICWSRSVHKDIDEPKEVYFRYCLDPLAIAIVPIVKPSDLPKLGVRTYKVYRQGVCARGVLTLLGVKVEQRQRVSCHIEDGKLVIELEQLKTVPTK